jgi:hypothetical protein
LVDRPSEDVDLFTNRLGGAAFADSVDAVAHAYRDEGWAITVSRRTESFARLEVDEPASARAGRVELAYDWRGSPPAQMSIGPVLAEADAVAAKMTATYGRGEARDYIDVVAILDSGKYDKATLLNLAAATDAGFDRALFAQALTAADRFPDEEFARYGLTAEQISALRDILHRWVGELTGEAE